MNLKYSLILFLSLITCRNSYGQDIISYIYGNGYPFEQKVANQAIRCIARQCLDGLKRSKFVDNDTYYDKRLDIYIDSLNTLLKTGRATQLDPEIKRHYYIETSIPELTFYGTFEDKESKEIFFQIKLELAYRSGLLRAKRITLIDKYFTEYKGLRAYFYEYSIERGSQTNLPPFPPYPPSPPAIETPIIYNNEFNLCSDCPIIKFISRDNNRDFWLYEKYKYEWLRTLGFGKIMAKQNNKFGVIDHDNNILIPFTYDKIEPTGILGYFIVTKDSLQGIYDYEGKVHTPIEYSSIIMRATFYNQKPIGFHFIVKQNDKVGVMNSKKKLVIPIKYDTVELFFSKYFRIKKDNKYSLFDLEGNPVSSQKYKGIDLGHYSTYNDRIIFTTSKGKKMLAIITEKRGKYKVKKVKLE